MKKSKLIVILGLCLLLAGALSGCINPTQENNNTDGPSDNAAGTNGGGGGGGGDGGGDGGSSGTAEELDVDTENMTVECDVQGSVITPEQTDKVDSVYSRIGPPFDPRKAEAMLHRELNELRTTHGNDSVEPLLCDPNIREIAQEHSRVMERFRFLGPAVPEGEIPEERNITTNPEYGNLSVRYDSVCRGVTESYGRWLYQRNKDVDWDGGALQQRDDVNVIANHEELVRDMRGVWFSDRANLSNPLGIVELRIVDEEDESGEVEEAKESMEYLTDGNYTRQGIGMHIDRRSREVYVTQVLC